MIKKTYIIGNWKMNLSYQETIRLAQNLTANYQQKQNQELVIAPQFPMLQSIASLLQNSPIKISAQNCASQNSGAYTGEVSVSLLQEFCNYCIIGHSERRNIFKESVSEVAEKFFLLQKTGIVPIFCVGETLEQRKAGKLEELLKEQLQPILKTTNENFLVAYEPVWAIGTGEIASVKQISQVHNFLWDLLTKEKKKVPILYGGSVNSQNSAELLGIDKLHGLLVGGASLRAQDFLAITK